ncbi:MAG TPA: hypothetical protein VFX98_02000, partial [Longimicrobiaceae bacterium]|nr:hypothetical protein [Longimicrobiaceae bacterium]
TGSGIVPVSGPPTPELRPGLAPRFGVRAGPRRDHAWEARLRARERREVAGRAGTDGRFRPNRTPAGARRAITPGVPAVGALMTLNVETDFACSNADNRTGRVVAVGTSVIVMEDTMNPAGGLTTADYEAIADTFDTFIHPVITANFGAPADIDGNGRVIAFYTRAVNELTPEGSGSFTGGFVFSRDLLTAAQCATSNVGEMFYMLAADPSGEVNNNPRSVSFVLEQTVGTLGHEYQHLINSSRRIHVNTPWNGLLEEGWLNEGLSHIGEELLLYAASGFAPGANLDLGDFGGVQQTDAFFAYAHDNFARLREWLLTPEDEGPFQLDGDQPDLATRGAAWAFMRYAADRDGGAQAAFWSALINTQEIGLDNLQTVLGTDPLPWFRDWAAATYIDDAAGSPAAQYTQPSWNFRSMYSGLDFSPGPACSCAYELDPRDPANGVADAFTLVDGGAAAYARMGVAANAFAGVTILSGGVAPPGTVRVAVIRRE